MPKLAILVRLVTGGQEIVHQKSRTAVRPESSAANDSSRLARRSDFPHAARLNVGILLRIAAHLGVSRQLCRDWTCRLAPDGTCGVTPKAVKDNAGALNRQSNSGAFVLIKSPGHLTSNLVRGGFFHAIDHE